jgi:chloride channel protein, CIC family
MVEVGRQSQESTLQGKAYLRLVLLGGLIGVPAAFLAALFLAVVNQLQTWLWDDLPSALGAASPPWYLVVGLPAVGALVVVAARLLLPGDGGHSPLDGIKSGATPVSAGPGIALAALGTLAFGAVLGPEAPLIALGSVVGVAVTGFVRLSSRDTQVVATAGSFSAISALFDGPLVAGMLLLETGVGLGAALIPALLPGLVAAAVGYVIFIGLGNWAGLGTTALSVPGLPPYVGTSLRDLVFAVVVGFVAALLMAAVRLLGLRVRNLSGGRARLAVLLVCGGVVTGLLAQLAEVLGADSRLVLFSGQESMPDIVRESSAGVVLVVLVAKALGYAVCLGCGFRGGPVFPSVFLGTALAMLAVLWLDVSPTLAVAVGAAAGMAAMTRLLFASLLLATLLAGIQGIDAIPAAVLAAATAWITAAALAGRIEAAGRPR